MATPFSLLLDEIGLATEVASSAFAFRNQVKPQSIMQLWQKLGLFISETLKTQKGVLLPNLGSFRVGPVVGENVKKIRPQFQLLEGRYGGVSQERQKFAVGGKATIVQPNYGLLSTAAGVHRGSTQRLIAGQPSPSFSFSFSFHLPPPIHTTLNSSLPPSLSCHSYRVPTATGGPHFIGQAHQGRLPWRGEAGDESWWKGGVHL